MPKAALVRVVGLGWLALLATAKPRFGPWGPLDVVMLAWLAIEVAATFWSQSPLLSVVGEVLQHEGLLTSLGLVGIYFALRFGAQGCAGPGPANTARTARGTVGIILSATALACLYALVQVLGHDPIHWLRTADYGPQARPFGTLGHPNLLGVMSAACAAVALAGAVQEERWQWLYAGAAALCVATAVSTFSRGAWLGLVAGVTAAMLVGRIWRLGPLRLRSRRRLLGSAGALAFVLLLTLSGVRGELLRARLGDLVHPRGGSAASRVEIWRAALAAWRARPWLGHGPDTFELVFPRYQTASYWRYEWTGLPFHAHSLYLNTLATRGVGGIVVGLGWILALAWTARRVWERGGTGRSLVPGLVGGCCAVGVAGAFGAIGVSGWLFLVTAAAVLAGAAGPEIAPGLDAECGAADAAVGQQPQRGRVRALRRAGNDSVAAPRRAWIAGGIVTGMACLWTWTDLEASRAAAGARAAMQHDAALADAYTARALRLRPFADWAHRMRAEALEARAATVDTPSDVLHRAVAAALRAVEIEPERNLNHYRLAKALLALAAQGDVEATRQAAAAFRRCIEISPVDAVSMLELARLELRSGDAAVALAHASRAAGLYPEEGATQSLLAATLLDTGRVSEARLALERAIAAEWHGNDEALQTARILLESLR